MNNGDNQDDSSEPPPFDVHIARQLIGKRVLIGLTFVEQGEVDRLEQMHGVVEDVTEDGFAIHLPNNETYWLPPDLRPWKAAAKGQYRLRSTGEVVLDPDYITNRCVSTFLRRFLHRFSESVTSSPGWLIHATAGRAGGVGHTHRSEPRRRRITGARSAVDLVDSQRKPKPWMWSLLPERHSDLFHDSPRSQILGVVNADETLDV